MERNRYAHKCNCLQTKHPPRRPTGRMGCGPEEAQDSEPKTALVLVLVLVLVLFCVLVLVLVLVLGWFCCLLLGWFCCWLLVRLLFTPLRASERPLNIL